MVILVGFFFWRDSVVYGFNSPLTSLKELLFGSSWLPNSTFKKTHISTCFDTNMQQLIHYHSSLNCFFSMLQLGNTGWSIISSSKNRFLKREKNQSKPPLCFSSLLGFWRELSDFFWVHIMLWRKRKVYTALLYIIISTKISWSIEITLYYSVYF